jgi:hypothetical protein
LYVLQSKNLGPRGYTNLMAKKATPKKAVPTYKDSNGNPFVLVRGANAGVHAGYLEDRGNDTGYITLLNSRRVWSWEGSLTLSELSQSGTTAPESCRFGCQIPVLELLKVDTCELIHCSDVAVKSILVDVPLWT